MKFNEVERPPVRPRYDSDSQGSSSSNARPTLSEESSDIPSASEASDARSDESDQSSTDGAKHAESLDDVSFGALAKAQQSLEFNPRKRKLSQPHVLEEDGNQSERDSDLDRKQKSEPKDLSRSSKHAPTVQSSRKPVSRKRVVFSPPPVAKSRDPRFDATVIADATRGNRTSSQAANKHYGFLSEYQAAEVLELKSQLKKTKDPEQQSDLRKQIMSIEAKLRNAQTKQREAEIMSQHKQQEKAAIRAGKKSQPYYLKQSELKKQIQRERLEGMTKRAKDKSEMRQRKRQKHKEARAMPRARRTKVN